MFRNKSRKIKFLGLINSLFLSRKTTCVPIALQYIRSAYPMYILSVLFVCSCFLFICFQMKRSVWISGRSINYTHLNTTKIILTFWWIAVENPEALHSSKVSSVDTIQSNSAADRCVLWFNNRTKSFIKIPGLGIPYIKEQKLKQTNWP
jgi:hypothetical protein